MDRWTEGNLIANRYRLVAPVGSGAQGQVWRAEDRHRDNLVVALKRSGSANAEARREAEALFRVEHPSLPRALDFGLTPSGGAWLAMEHIDARSLAQPTPLAALAGVALDVADALAALHDAGLTHGDVKPANILTRGERAWLVDLGLSTHTHRDAALPAGTLRYLSPERLAGERGAAADLFALGVTLVESLTGQHPFTASPDDRDALLLALATRARPRAEVMEALPSPSRETLAWLLEHDPERRPWSARAWAARWARDLGLPMPEAEREEVPRTVALVGREDERQRIASALVAALAGDGLGVVVTGPSGAGRRRVAEEALRACRIVGAARGNVFELRDELSDDVERPTVVLLLDADEERLARSLDALRRLRRYGAAPAPVALLATAGGSPPDTVVGDFAVVPLRPLERPQVRELLAALRGATLSTGTLDAWIDATAGLPGRIVSVARVLGAARIARASRDELYQRAAALHRARVPSSLSGAARRGALQLSLAGASLPRSVLLAAMGDEASAALASLDAAGVVRCFGARVTLTTPLEDDAPPDARREAAAALAEALATETPDAHGLRALAAHAAGQHAEAWRHAERAAADLSIPRADALRALERCADAAPDATACALAIARTLLLAGDADRALDALADAAPSTAVHTLTLDALRRAGRRDEAHGLALRLAEGVDVTARTLGELTLAREALDRGDLDAAAAAIAALGDASTLPPTLRPRLLELGGLVATALGDLSRAGERLARADTLALEAGDIAQRGRVRSVAGMLAQRRGDHETARRAYRDAWALAVEAGDPHAAAAYMCNVGAAELDAGALGEALRWLTRATRALATLGRMPELARALANEASLLAWIGDRPGARDAARRARDAATAVGDAVAVAFADMLAADVADDAREAARGLTAAARAFTAAGDEARGAEALARAVLRLVRAGAVDEAADAARWTDDGAMTTLAATELAVARRAPQREVEALVARAREAVARDPAAEHALELLRVEEAAATARGDRVEAARVAGLRRRRVEALAATLPEALARCFVAQHAPREGERAGEGARDAARWRRLVAITHRLNDEPRLRALLDLVVDATVELTSASRGFVLLKGDDGELRVRAARNIGERDLEGDEMAFSRSVAEHVARAGEALVTVDASADGRFHASASVAAMQLRSVLAVPLRVHGEAVGTVYVDDRFRVGAFGDEDVDVARAFADAAAVAIHNARARSELQRALRRAERLSEELERRVDAQRVELEAVRQTLAQDASRGSYEGIVGRGPAMARLLALIDRVAPTAMPVLLQGESGTGKELVARAIHANSPRAARAFVAENCGAVTETLLESTLFGHVRGAFTGADRNRAGLFEVADGGTLFLDEVGEMSPAMQAKLLRVLQEGEVRPVGGERSRKVDVRVIAATHRDLQEMVRKGTFREDLYYRLAVMVLPIPSLRERREDIPLLVAHFLARGDRKVEIDRKAMARLVASPWPGNVRQLENEIARAAVLSDGIIREDDLSVAATPSHPAPSVAARATEGNTSGLDLRNAVTDVERDLVERALREHGWNQSRAARALGLSRFGLQKKLKRLGIPPKDPQRARAAR